MSMDVHYLLHGSFSHISSHVFPVVAYWCYAVGRHQQMLLQVPTQLHRDRLSLDDLLWHIRNNPPSHRGILERADGKLKSNLK